MAWPEPWRRNLQPASYNGVGFFVAVDSKAGGRRSVTHEFPKLDTPYTEDMGRRARKFTIAGYVIQSVNNGFDYTIGRDLLSDALDSEGPGVLVHPTLGVSTVQPGDYNVTEHLEERGGMAEFAMTFTEAGALPSSTPVADTVSNSNTAAQNSITSFQGSSDITALGAPTDAFGQ